MVLLLSAMAGCTTKFWGSATIPKGPVGCRAACDGWGMELAGMVKMSEYSDGCICQVKRETPAAGPAAARGVPLAESTSAAVISAAAGVFVQMEAEAQRASQSRH